VLHTHQLRAIPGGVRRLPVFHHDLHSRRCCLWTLYTSSTMIQPSYSVDDGSDGSSGADEESYISTFFVRALYDYQSNDPSSLSFRRDDIIEVLTRLDSGWWDGLLGDERGWFPSNYVAVISTQEAEATLGALDASSTVASSEPADSMIDMADVMGDQLGDNGWGQTGIDMDAVSNATSQTPTANSATDFWVPQVTPDGQVCYMLYRLA
jgi:son of sevenless